MHALPGRPGRDEFRRGSGELHTFGRDALLKDNVRSSCFDGSGEGGAWGNYPIAILCTTQPQTANTLTLINEGPVHQGEDEIVLREMSLYEPTLNCPL